MRFECTRDVAPKRQSNCRGGVILLSSWLIDIWQSIAVVAQWQPSSYSKNSLPFLRLLDICPQECPSHSLPPPPPPPPSPSSAPLNPSAPPPKRLDRRANERTNEADSSKLDANLAPLQRADDEERQANFSRRRSIVRKAKRSRRRRWRSESKDELISFESRRRRYLLPPFSPRGRQGKGGIRSKHSFVRALPPSASTVLTDRNESPSLRASPLL